jgi:hypothetical protein
MSPVRIPRMTRLLPQNPTQPIHSMKRTNPSHPFIIRCAAVAVAAFTGLSLGQAADLPASGTKETPLLILRPEHNPPLPPETDEARRAFDGKVVAHQGEDYISAQKEGVISAHKGFGNWSIAFQFAVDPAPVAGDYTFWAHWSQGGDPGASAQKFDIFAGPTAEALEPRGTYTFVAEDPWKMGWANAPKALTLKAEDKVIEVRNSGQADGAKIFDLFLLSPGNPPPPKAQEKRVGEIRKLEDGAARTSVGDLPPQEPIASKAILLELGSAPASTATEKFVAYAGEVTTHEGDRGIETRASEVTSLRAGQGPWLTAFRFKLAPDHPAGDYTFWARWKQGGDPVTSEQKWEVWAGADESSLTLRTKASMKPGGWNYVWRAGGKVTIKPEDAIIEVRNGGSGQTAKTFSAFLLGGAVPPPTPVALPVKGTPEKPVVILGFGKTPLDHREPKPEELVFSGTLTARPNAFAGGVGGNVVNVQHKGFGEFGATLQFNLNKEIPAGYYTFHANYLSGGEVSQVKQTFVVKAGPDASQLGVRGTFDTVNNTPFKNKWVSGRGTLTIFPGDKLIQIVNNGKAHDIKQFHGFALGLEKAMPAWLVAESAKKRTQFLAMAKRVPRPEGTLYVLDGEGPDEILFSGLGQESLKPFFDKTTVEYLLGEDSDAHATMLNINARPAAVYVNNDRKVTGVLSAPADAEAVIAFANGQGKGGVIPTYAEIKQPEPAALKEGTPEKWLVGIGWPGRCGVSRWGIDAEALQRPNPGDAYGFGFYTAGNRYDKWKESPSEAGGVTWLWDKTPESFVWGKATGYAVLYVKADEPVKATLRFQHSGIQHAVYLDEAEQKTTPDSAAPFKMDRRPAPAAGQVVVDRPGQEIHDDVSVPQAAEGPVAVPLTFTKGWHCLILKLVNAQNKGESVILASKFTDENGKPVTSLKTQTSDPTVPLGPARGAAGFWPLLTLEKVPGNLPHPGEKLTLVADMRVARSFMDRGALPKLFLPIEGRLKVRMMDYDGNEMKSFETTGSFPSVVKIDIGKAPAPGFYSLIPELYGADGKLIHRFHPDGFSVVLGNTAQKERGDKKEVMNNWYYLFGSDWPFDADWLDRMGLVKNVGSTPGLPADAIAKWEEAKRRGLILFADFAGDSNWMNNSDPENKKVIEQLPKYTRYFKGINEIDGRFGGDDGVGWHVSRNPAKYVERAKFHYEGVHKARPDAIYYGGSVYTSGNKRSRADHPEILGPREWLKKCLELGLDKYIDEWDVHAYPQTPPKLEAPSISNSPNETDLGVLSVYKEVGIPFTKKFLMGETSAMVWHGFEGLRWQAATAAKMAAWTNSREDWTGVAFCAANHDRRLTAEEYGMLRNPGEAALYTASALIDGLPYKRVKTEDGQIQAATFGNTLMVWRADDKPGEYTATLDGSGPWVIVDVVGRVKPLEVKEGKATIQIGMSPVYVLAKAEYEKLTR